MVTIDGTDTKTLGFGVRSIIGSQDILKRKVQDEFGFADSDGEQYYCTTEDMVFQGRSIVLEGHMVQSRSSFESTLNTLKTTLNAAGLRAIVTPYSTVAHNCFANEGLQVVRLSKWGQTKVYADLRLHLYEPEPDDSKLAGDTMPTAETIPPGGVPVDDAQWRMDDRSFWYNWGMRVANLQGLFSQQRQKDFPVFSDPFTQGEPSYQASGEVFYEAKDLKMQLIMRRPTMAQLAESLRLFKHYLFISGLRTFKLPHYDITFDAYCKDGGRVRMLTRSTNVEQIAEIELKLRMP